MKAVYGSSIANGMFFFLHATGLVTTLILTPTAWFLFRFPRGLLVSVLLFLLFLVCAAFTVARYSYARHQTCDELESLGLSSGKTLEASSRS